MTPSLTLHERSLHGQSHRIWPENGVPNVDGLHPASSWYFTAVHRNTSDGTPDGYCGQPDEVRYESRHVRGTNLSNWHVWGGRWTNGQLCTYLDQQPILCLEPYDSTAQPMVMVFTMQYLPQCDGCPPRPPELEMQVDWVRVWQRR